MTGRWALLWVCLTLAACQRTPTDYYAAPPIHGADAAAVPAAAPPDTVATAAAAQGGQPAVPPSDAVAGATAAAAPAGASETTDDAVDQPPTAAAPSAAATAPKPPRPSAPQPPDVSLPDFASLFKALSPSVVNIYTTEQVKRRLPSPFGVGEPSAGTSLGTGLVYNADGTIVTNAHVVENAAEIRVRFVDGEELPARLVGIDPVRDLALLKVDGARGLEPVVGGDSDTLQVGDWVLAIGNPLGLSHTLTKGIVSARGRVELLSDVEPLGYLDLIQTDAAINQGNSGGPLFNLSGQVVGLCTAVSAEGQGIGFAIPWNQVQAAIPRLEQGGQVSRSWLGVYLRPLDPTARVADDVPRGGGVLVEAVVDDSPAARANLEPGDIIVRFDARQVRNISEFRLSVAAGVAGKPVPLTVIRGNKRLKLKVTLREAR